MNDPTAYIIESRQPDGSWRAASIRRSHAEAAAIANRPVMTGPDMRVRPIPLSAVGAEPPPLARRVAALLTPPPVAAAIPSEVTMTLLNEETGESVVVDAVKTLRWARNAWGDDDATIWDIGCWIIQYGEHLTRVISDTPQSDAEIADEALAYEPAAYLAISGICACRPDRLDDPANEPIGSGGPWVITAIDLPTLATYLRAEMPDQYLAMRAEVLA